MNDELANIRSLLQHNVPRDRKRTLRSLLHHNVPRFIKHIKDRGGVSDDEWAWLKCTDDSPDYPEGLFDRADEYLLYPHDLEIFNKGVFVLVLTLAIMSFVPLGVAIFDLRYDSEVEGFVR